MKAVSLPASSGQGGSPIRPHPVEPAAAQQLLHRIDTVLDLLARQNTHLAAIGPPAARAVVSCAEMRNITTHHRDDIRAKMDDLKNLERLLARR